MQKMLVQRLELLFSRWIGQALLKRDGDFLWATWDDVQMCLILFICFGILVFVFRRLIRPFFTSYRVMAFFITLSVFLHMDGDLTEAHCAGEEGQSPGEGSRRRELDLNESADPELACADVFRLSLRELTRLVQNMRPIEREGIFPNVKYPINTNPEIRAAIREFLKQRDTSTLGSDLSALVGGAGKNSSLFQDFIDYQLQKLS